MKRLIAVLAVVVLAAYGCSQKAAPSTSVMDTPEYHYAQGLKYLEKDQLAEAHREFNRAIDLAPAGPLGYIGKGLVLGKEADFTQAFAVMSKAKQYDQGIESRIGMIRLFTMQMSKEQAKAATLLKKAENEFSNAIEKEPNSAPLHYYMGMADMTALDFDKAAGMFKKVLEINKEFTGQANAEWATIQKIQRAAPGTEIGKKIALIQKIDRADVAALFDQEMNLEKLFTKRGIKVYDTAFKPPTESTNRFSPDKTVSMPAATDISDNWLRPSIESVLHLRIRGLEAGPNHLFEPDKLITKTEFALMLEDLLIKVTGDEKLATKFLGATSPFPEVRNDHYAFNAIMVTTSRGFLEADKATGEFHGMDFVSGADALLAIRAFKDQLKF
ncbi:MAG: hypothetical protein WC539_02485 [Nitrospirota bacterium]